MFQLKPISRQGIPEALEKAERYRLLNEPLLAESICLDILAIEPNNTTAIVTMLLAITDQFGTSPHADVSYAKQMLHQLSDPYEQHYYGGLICERQGKAALGKRMPGAEFTAYEWLTEAMEYYEKAEAIRPANNDEAILRWNTCVRMITAHHLKPRPEERVEYPLDV